jgi:hypothetical protein
MPSRKKLNTLLFPQVVSSLPMTIRNRSNSFSLCSSAADIGLTEKSAQDVNAHRFFAGESAGLNWRKQGETYRMLA